MKTKKFRFAKIMKEHYDKRADKWVIDTNKEPAKFYYNCYTKVLFNGNLQGDKAIDIGCGAGTFTFELSKYKFKKIYALDFSERMLCNLNKEIKKRKIKNIETIKGNVENLPFKDNYFDFIVLVGVMECLSNKKKALKEIHRILKPKGVVAIRWLNDEGLWGYIEFLRRVLGFESGPSSSNFSKLDEVMYQLKQVGFKINNIKGMIMLPLFIFPFPISWFLQTLLVKSKLTYKIEGIKNNDKKTIKRWYYSFCTVLKK